MRASFYWEAMLRKRTPAEVECFGLMQLKLILSAFISCCQFSELHWTHLHFRYFQIQGTPSMMQHDDIFSSTTSRWILKSANRSACILTVWPILLKPCFLSWPETRQILGLSGQALWGEPAPTVRNDKSESETVEACHKGCWGKEMFCLSNSCLILFEYVWYTFDILIYIYTYTHIQTS